MTPEAQNRAIAESVGAKYHKPTESEIASGSYYQYEPDYLTDLNLMHSAEKTGLVTLEQWRRYSDLLTSLIEDSTALVCRVDARYRTAHATAAQRAEAYLRCIGKWEKEQLT